MTSPSSTREKETLASSSESAAGNASRRFKPSYVLTALILLFAVDLIARAFYHPDPYNSPNRSFIYWTVKEFRERTDHPDVALLGSSLMSAVINDGDATYMKRSFDALTHHRALYLEHLLSQSGISTDTATFAIGGEMASDAYALTVTLLKGEKKPAALIWGIAPRDFLDCTFKRPDSSETIHYLTKIEDGKDILGDCKPGFYQALSASLDQALYLYRKRFDIVADQLQSTGSLLQALRGEDASTGTKIPQALLKSMVRDLPDDNFPGEWLSTPYSPSNPPFPDNTIEYQQRYRYFDARIFEKQLSFLEKTLAYCKSNGIYVVLVNMPLQESNLALLPDRAYTRYLSRTQALSKRFSGSYIDLNKPGLFQPQDFGDTAHLNGRGGVRFFELLSQALRDDVRFTKAAASGQERSNHSQDR